MGLSIGSVDKGYSKSGAEAFKHKIHKEAIEDTKAAVAKIEGIRSAVEAGWQGKSEENFMANLQKGVQEVQKALDELDKALMAEFDNIHNAWMAQDDEMVPLD